MTYDPGFMRRFITEGLRSCDAASVPASTLYAHYLDWAAAAGVEPRFMGTASAFGRTLKANGVQWRRTSAAVLYLGVVPVAPDTP